MNLADPVDTLARTIYGEARGDGAAGMEAVASVVCNRLALGGWWGDDVCSICLKPEQFDCWDHGDPNLIQIQDVDESDPVFQTALEIAVDAVAGRLPDSVHGATSYKVTTEPWPRSWGVEVLPVAVVGHQSFYILK